MNKIILTLIAVLCMMSCSRRTELLDTIPATAQATGMIDMKRLCDESGITLSATGADLSPALKSRIGSSQNTMGLLDLMGRLHTSGAADISETALIVTDNAAIMTLILNDGDEFKNIDSPWLTWGEKSGGLDTGTLGDDMAVVASNDQVWILQDNVAPVKTVKKLLDDAAGESIGGIEAIARSLTRGDLADIAINGSDISKTPAKERHEALLESSWTTLGVKTSDGRLNADIRLIKGTGEDIPFKGLKPINPALLGYVPGSFGLTVAMGVTPEFDWSAITGLAALAGGFQTQAALAVITPYLESVDGTVLISAGPANSDAFSDPDPSNWQFLIMAAMSQQKIDQLLGMIRTMMFTAGVTPRVEKDGTMVIPQYGTNLYVGCVDGCFAVSTLPFDPNRQNALAPQFVNKEVAASILIPSLAGITGNAPGWGVDIKCDYTGAEGHLTLSLPGSEGSVISNILQLL